MKGVFVTGTDTDVGKTRISVALIEYWQQRGKRVAGMKPVASGCQRTGSGLFNEDAQQLMAQSSVSLAYEWVNPYAFEPPIAPHIAAQQTSTTIDITLIQRRFNQIGTQVDITVAEGAGGWLVPINAQQTMADIACALALPVILVVDIRLGCINHALLTATAIRHAGCELYGWVANQKHAHPQAEAIIASLLHWIPAPCLGQIPQLSQGESAVRYLSLPSKQD